MQKKKDKISIIIPCYNKQNTLLVFYNEVINILRNMNCEYEFIFVNDGSTDGTLDFLRKLSQKDPHVIYLSFSRNFGQESAIYAGLCNAQGGYVAVMDADMQDLLYLLPDMLDILHREQYDCVATRRVDRAEKPFIKSWFARGFYKIINCISDINIVDGAINYRLMKRKMVEAIVSMEEYNRFSKGIFGWIGFRTYWISFENSKSIAGETRWSFVKLLKYVIDGIINFSNVPLSIASGAGIIMTIFSFIILILIIVKKIVVGDPVMGWSSLMCIVVLIGGIQLLSFGIMGQYIGKVYSETKRRPHFIIAEGNFVEDEKKDKNG